MSVAFTGQKSDKRRRDSEMPKNRDDRSGSMGDGKNGSGNRKKPAPSAPAAPPKGGGSSPKRGAAGRRSSAAFCQF